MESSSPPQAPERPRPRLGRLLVVLGGVVLVLCVVFAVRTLDQRREFQTYKDATLGAPPPWSQRAFSVEACVDHGVDWAMQCPGIESWCFNEAPQLVRACLESADRSRYCAEVGDAVSITGFGYAQCDERRQEVEGRYAKRTHKKHCAAAYRAVAEHCRRAPEA